MGEVMDIHRPVDRQDFRTAHLKTLRELGVEGIVVTIPCLSKVIGVPKSSLYHRINQGSLFLPVRDLHGSPVVLVEDLLDWICGECHSARHKAPRTKECSPTEVSEVTRNSWKHRATGAAEAAVKPTPFAQK